MKVIVRVITRIITTYKEQPLHENRGELSFVKL